MAPEVASRILLSWLQGREPEIHLPGEAIERLADALQEANPDGTHPADHSNELASIAEEVAR